MIRKDAVWLFAIPFILFFITFYLIKSQFLVPVAVFILVVYGISFYASKTAFMNVKIYSFIGYVLAFLLNVYILGWI